MSLRLGIAIGASEVEHLVTSADTLAEARKLVATRRARLANVGRPQAARLLREAVLQAVYRVLLDTEPGDDLDEDVMPQVEHMVREVLGG